MSLEQKELIWSEKEVKTGATSKKDGMYNMQKIRSLPNWQNDYPTFAWCASLGDGWYLPALKELKAISAQRTAIDKALKAKGKSELGGYHWSSTQDNESHAWLVHMYDGDTSSNYKSNDYSVRAVSAF